MERTTAAVAGALALVAPGKPLREGLERVLLANRGALIVVGDGADVLSICTGGFLLDAEFTPVSYTHLDVYKRQRVPGAGAPAGGVTPQGNR